MIVIKLDIKFSAHDAFLGSPSSSMLKVEGLESHIHNFIILRAKTTGSKNDNQNLPLEVTVSL